MSTNELRAKLTSLPRDVSEWMDNDKYIAQNFIDDWLASTPADDDTPIDEAWLLACGWRTWPEFRGDREFDLYMRAGNDVMWHRRLAWKPHAVWVVRMCDPDENDGLSSEFVSVLGNYGTTARPTRGQLRRLCSALGVELKEPA